MTRSPEPIMINPDQNMLLIRIVGDEPGALQTLLVWNFAVTYLQPDTGKILAGRDVLADLVGTSPDEVDRALARLAEIGALVPEKSGGYAVNPNIAWCGSLAKREIAARSVAPLRAPPRMD